MQIVSYSKLRGSRFLERSLGLLLRNRQCKLCDGRKRVWKFLLFFEESIAFIVLIIYILCMELIIESRVSIYENWKGEIITTINWNEVIQSLISSLRKICLFNLFLHFKIYKPDSYLIWFLELPPANIVGLSSMQFGLKGLFW